MNRLLNSPRFLLTLALLAFIGGIALGWPRSDNDDAQELLFRSLRKPSSSPNPPAKTPPKPAGPVIYTYFQPLKGNEIPPLDAKLIQAWSKNWAAAGWTPVVLSEKDARQHPEFESLEPELKKLPSVNPTNYDLSCYYRWIAVAAKGGGFMADSDLFNYGFPPQPTPPNLTLYTHPAPVPCIVSGPASGFMAAVHAFSTHTPSEKDKVNGLPHTSDMFIVQKRRDLFEIIPVVGELGLPHWKEAKLVHYSHAGVTRWAKEEEIEDRAVLRDRTAVIERIEREELGFGK